jgi:hypothetical protein
MDAAGQLDKVSMLEFNALLNALATRLSLSSLDISR